MEGSRERPQVSRILPVDVLESMQIYNLTVDPTGPIYGIAPQHPGAYENPIHTAFDTLHA